MRRVKGVCIALIGVYFATREARADELRLPLEILARPKGQTQEVVLEAAVRTHLFPAAQDQVNGDTYKLRSPVYILRHASGKLKGDKAKIALIGTEKDPGDLVGPTIHVRKDSRLKIKLLNRLNPHLLPKEVDNPPHNYPFGFATTNLHTHGLHVSPSGRADNIYVETKVGEEHQFVYEIPKNHPAGTFWYHPHKHGSVAIQLTGGMAGALIVDEDDEMKKPWEHTDSLYPGKSANEQPAEKIFVLQQVHGSLPDPNTPASKSPLTVQLSDIYDKAKSAAVPVTPSWRNQKARQRQQMAAKLASLMPPAAPKMEDDCKEVVNDHIVQDPQTKQNSFNATEWLLVNGQATGKLARTITMRPCEIQRWRFIHAGLDEVIKLAVVLETMNAKGEVVKRERQVLHDIAIDGVPREKIKKRDHYVLYPAYRWDVLFQAPAQIAANTKLILYSDCAPANMTLSGLDVLKTPIAVIIVKADPNRVTPELGFPKKEDVRRRVPAEFLGGISDKEVGNRRWNLRFDFPDVGPSRFLINGHEYSSRVDRFVRLGTAEEWHIESGTGTKNAAGHPFHIHVNPFLHYVYRPILLLNISPDNSKSSVTIAATTLLTDLGFAATDNLLFTRKPPGGKALPGPLGFQAGTLTLKDVGDSIAQWLTGQPDYKMLGTKFEVKAGQTDVGQTTRALVIRSARGVIEDLTIDFTSDTSSSANLSFTRDRELVDRIWRDTLMAPAGGTQIVRMRFRDWTGDTVLHCHIVDHEDQGMMKNIRILGPNDSLPAGGAKVNAHGAGRATLAPAFAPEFSLPDADGKRYTLGKPTGQGVVLVFFRGSGCLECVKQLQALKGIHHQLIAKGVELVAVSSTTRDDLLAAQGQLPAGKKLPFLLLADAEHSVFEQYGCLGPEDAVPLHGTFLIDARGKICWRDVGDEPWMNMERVLAEANRLVTAGGVPTRTATAPR